MDDISGKAPDKEAGTSYQQPFPSAVPDRGPVSVGGPTLGMKEMGPNGSNFNRKANSDAEQVVPQSTVIGGGSPGLVDMMRSGQALHEVGRDPSPVRDSGNVMDQADDK